MKYIALFAFLCVAAVSGRPRSKRAAFELPDGADLLVANIRTSFQCPQDSEGYYADIENNCQIFHVCHTTNHDDGTSDTQQWSFLCGNQTVFNQFSFTCAMPEEAIPCSDAASFFYLNDNLRRGDPDVLFHQEEDVARAAPLIQGQRHLYGGGQAPPPPRPGRG